jgi:hypothetical protein
VGLTAGALTLEVFDGATGGAEVTYQYLVTNDGDPLGGVSVVDDLLPIRCWWRRWRSTAT